MKSKLRRNLENRVVKAIKNACPATFYHDRSTTDISEEETVKDRTKFEGVGIEEYVNLGPYTVDDSNSVTVGTPKDYRVLLEIAYTLAAIENNKKYNLSGKEIARRVRSRVEADLEHELEHAKPLHGNQEVKIRWRVRFYRDRSSGNLLYLPSITLYGQIKKSDFITTVNAASDLSNHDRLMNGN